MANSRDNILSALKAVNTASSPLPVLKSFEQSGEPIARFMSVLQSIGGKVYRVTNDQEIVEIIRRDIPGIQRVVSALPGFTSIAEIDQPYTDPSSLHDVDLFIAGASLAVAENGAVWLKESDMHERVLPFIAKNVAVIIQRHSIVPTMFEAYQAIGNSEYGFAAFIAGPSKTADIEQSLVLGAHGAITMRVFIV